jgi:hypothetical protein
MWILKQDTCTGSGRTDTHVLYSRKHAPDNNNNELIHHALFASALAVLKFTFPMTSSISHAKPLKLGGCAMQRPAPASKSEQQVKCHYLAPVKAAEELGAE